MELAELEARLTPFCQHHYNTQDVQISQVHAMPGHAGFAYGFTVKPASGALQPHREADRWFIRLPPPNVNWQGTADVLRQVAVLNALDATTVPHCSVQWSGSDLQWFDRPYFVVPHLDGDVLRLADGEWGSQLSENQRYGLAQQIMTALAGLHKVDISQVTYLGDALPFADDVTRWDRFYAKAADPECLADVPLVRQKLLDNMPANAPTGIFHGDFQTANLFCSNDVLAEQPKLLAVIDFELTGIGSTLNDLGWICTFSDLDAWPKDRGSRAAFMDPLTLANLYEEAYGAPVEHLNWYRALAAYKFAIITGFNLSLHRRGKRVDDTWEETKFSMTPLINRANELLG